MSESRLCTICGKYPFNVVKLYKSSITGAFLGSVQCSGIIWISNLDNYSRVSVKINPPVDLYVVPTTPTTTTTTTTTTIPQTTTKMPKKTTVAYMAPIPTTTIKRQIVTATSGMKRITTAPKPQPPVNRYSSTQEPIILPSQDGNSQTSDLNRRKDYSFTTRDAQLPRISSTISPTPTQPLPLSLVDKFKMWLYQNNLKSISNACSAWSINMSYDTKLNATAVRKIIQASCSDTNFLISLFFAFDFDIKRQNFDRPLLAFYNETSWGFQYSNDSSSIWVENRYNYQVSTLPKMMQSIVKQQCPGLQTSISSFTNKNVTLYDYTRVICTQMTSKSLYMKSFTPRDSEPVFVKLYTDMPFYVQEVYKSGFSTYRTVVEYPELVSVNQSVTKMGRVRKELMISGCNSGSYSIYRVHGDIKTDCKSYFVELLCKERPDKVFYLEYEKPDYPQTAITLDSIDVVPTQLQSAQTLLHPKYTLVLKSFNISKILRRTINLKPAVKASNCSDYSVMLTYDNLVVELGRRVFVVVLYCPKRVTGDRVMYAVIATVVNADWFTPVLIDKLRNRPPDGF